MATLQEDLDSIDFAITRGTLEKPIYEMTPLEREVFYKEMAAKTRAYLFSIGQPLVHKKEGKVVAEYADGTITIIR